MRALIDCAGTVAEIDASNDVEIGRFRTSGCDGEEVVSVRNGDVVKPACKSDLLKVIRRGGAIVCHDSIGVV